MSRQFELVLVVLWYSAQVVFGEYSYSQCSNLHSSIAILYCTGMQYSYEYHSFRNE